MVFKKKIEEPEEEEEEENEEETEEDTEEVKEVKIKKEEVSLVETIKVKGLGLQMPDGLVLDLSNVEPGQAAWMAWATKTLQDIKKNIAG